MDGTSVTSLWAAVLDRAVRDARTDEAAQRWLYSKDADLVAVFGGWDLDAYHRFIDRVASTGWLRTTKEN